MSEQRRVSRVEVGQAPMMCPSTLGITMNGAPTQLGVGLQQRVRDRDADRGHCRLGLPLSDQVVVGERCATSGGGHAKDQRMRGAWWRRPGPHASTKMVSLQ